MKGGNTQPAKHLKTDFHQLTNGVAIRREKKREEGKEPAFLKKIKKTPETFAKAGVRINVGGKWKQRARGNKKKKKKKKKEKKNPRGKANER